MMTLKFSQNARVTRVLTGRRPVRPAADDDFETKLLNVSKDAVKKILSCLNTNKDKRIDKILANLLQGAADV